MKPKIFRNKNVSHNWCMCRNASEAFCSQSAMAKHEIIQETKCTQEKIISPNIMMEYLFLFHVWESIATCSYAFMSDPPMNFRFF